MNRQIQDYKNNLKGKKVSVIGIGISNRPLIQFLAECGAVVTAHDKKTAEELGEYVDTLRQLGVKTVLGEGYMEHIDGEIIYKTPGMRFDHPSLVQARAKGAQVTSEMEDFVQLCPATVIAVTGSDGKTTTTTLINKIMRHAGHHTYLGGNIGFPLLSKIEEIKSEDFVILELSSFQLHTMQKSPHVAVITNLSPNHLDMHKDYEEYIDAKKNIMRYQKTEDILVANLSNEKTAAIAKEAAGKVRMFSSKKDAQVCLKNGWIVYNGENILKISDIRIPGNHNIENFMAAIAATADYVSADSVRYVAKTFGGVAHRIEFVRELNGVKYYNSSIDSSPNRTINTLKVFHDPVVLIAGGKDKGIPYDDLGMPILEHVKCLVLIGATAEVIYDAVVNVQKESKLQMPEIVRVQNYSDAVNAAKAHAQSGDVVLLSNASTSFDMFSNFEERGNLFKELVNRL